MSLLSEKSISFFIVQLVHKLHVLMFCVKSLHFLVLDRKVLIINTHYLFRVRVLFTNSTSVSWDAFPRVAQKTHSNIIWVTYAPVFMHTFWIPVCLRNKRLIFTRFFYYRSKWSLSFIKRALRCFNLLI